MQADSIEETEKIISALADMRGLSLFSCREAPFLTAFGALLEGFGKPEPDDFMVLIERWAFFLKALVQTGASFSIAVGVSAFYDDNRFTHTAEAYESAELPPLLRAVAQADLSRLGRIAGFDLSGLGFHLAELLRTAGLGALAANVEEEARALRTAEQTGEASFLGIFPKAADWGESLTAFAAHLRANGAGELGRRTVFRWADRALTPVLHPDGIRLADLSGYEDQRQVIVTNTLRFLEGKPANNLLLYGDRGTGKSATVKAVCNEYARRGLRLLEVAKQDTPQLPAILDRLGTRGLRFIIFIDDLSFESPDDSFTTLKRVLEGGVEAKPPNTVVYATSNRRHLVKERLGDRPGAAAVADGDMRAFDAMQEQFSLADRFGLTVVFTAPGQDDFLSIAEYVAVRRGLLSDPPELEERRRFRDNALRWERWFNGRSPRTAVQYVDWAAGGAGFPWE